MRTAYLLTRKGRGVPLQHPSSWHPLHGPPLWHPPLSQHPLHGPPSFTAPPSWHPLSRNSPSWHPLTEHCHRTPYTEPPLPFDGTALQSIPSFMAPLLSWLPLHNAPFHGTPGWHHPPPVDRMTDGCKNITFPQRSNFCVVFG